MDDDLEIAIADLATDEIQELLEENGANLSLEQAAELLQFIADAGSIEAALELVAKLSPERRAA